MPVLINSYSAFGSPSFSVLNVQDVRSDGLDPIAQVSFKRDGTIESTTASSPDVYVENWVSGGATIGDGYWIRVTATSGTFSSSSGSGWLQLSSSRTWSVTVLTGMPLAKNCTFTVEIATDSGGSNIVFTRTSNQISAEWANE